MGHFKRFSVLIVAAAMLMLSLTGCGEKAEYAYDDNAPSLYKAYEDYFRVGCAVNTWNLAEGSNEEKIISKQFNTLVLENESKPDTMHPSESVYNFTPTDTFVEYCEDHDIVVRGHTLIWHSQCPDWFFKDGDKQASADLLMQRLKDHITTIVTHFKGKVDTWDVVNEVIGDGSPLRDSNWYRIIGDYDGDGDSYDFIEQAFIAARAADPDARLIINDYSLESSTDKAIRMYNAVKKMLEDGTPIDGIGLQMHIGTGQNLDTFKQNMEILLKLRDINPDLMFEVTEMDVSCYLEDQWGNPQLMTKEKLQELSDTYEAFFGYFMELAEQGVLDSVVMWGLHDGVSWLNGNHENYPMLIDRQMKLKDAYWAVFDLPKNK